MKFFYATLQIMTLLFISHYFTSCAPTYTRYITQYKKETKPAQTQPDYSNLYYWAAHPDKKDPSDSVPLPLQNEKTEADVDVFFLHPTTYTQKDFPAEEINASINDPEINAKTDYTSILYQASIFNGSARVFAPRYRQAHLSAFFSMDKQKAALAFDTAYADIKNAFIYYLQHYNHGRPIIIAAHSQGTWHAERLLKEFFDGKSLQNKLVYALLIGLPVAADPFQTIPLCKDSLSTGCFVSWRTLKKNYLPAYVKKETQKAAVVNPLLWTTDTTLASRQLNKGAILWKFNKLLPHPNNARIYKNVLWISKPKFPFSFLVPLKNFHPGDLNLFYMNIRANSFTRIHQYLQLHTVN
jgi:hypothetical protein